MIKKTTNISYSVSSCMQLFYQLRAISLCTLFILATLARPAFAADDDAALSSQGPSSTNPDAKAPEPAEKAGEPAKATTPATETKNAKDAQVSGQTAADEKPVPDFHAQTPDELKDRLRLAAGLSLGKGFGPNTDFSSDFLGFFVAAQYTLNSFSAAGLPLYWVATTKYASFTGVDTKRSLDMLVQRFLVGGGVEVIEENSVWRPGFALNLGVLKASGASIKSTKTTSPDVRPALSVEPYVRYRIAPKIWLFSGADISPLLGYSWYGLNLGATFSF